MNSFRTILEQIEAQIVEKKSKFISIVYPVHDKEEAENIIKMTKKQFYDAKHHCFAYRVIEEEGLLERCSDDGEPQGTAGAPLLTILRGNELCQVLVIVIRYFGGILLGTGGLVRAYSQATNLALEQASIIEKELGSEVEIIVHYSQLEGFKYYCNMHQLQIIKEEYMDNITILLEMSEKNWKELVSNIDKLNFNVIKMEEKRKKYISANMQN